MVLGEDLGTGLIDNLVGEWRLQYTSSNAMEYNQVGTDCCSLVSLVHRTKEFGSYMT